MMKPESTVEDIRPVTWTLALHLQSLDHSDDVVSESWHVTVNLSHLNVRDESGLQDLLRTTPTVKSVLDSPPVLRAQQKGEHSLTVDLSRNFFTFLDVDRTIDLICRACQHHVPRLDVQMGKRLTELNVMSNDLETWPALKNWPCLREVYINYNYIKEIPLGALDALPRLQILDARNNLLEKIDGLKQGLEGHQKLRHLSLSCNSLTSEALIHGLPSSLPALKVLGLFANYVEGSLESSLLLTNIKEMAPNLDDLYLLGNRITQRQDYREILSRQFLMLRLLDGRPLLVCGI